MDKDDSYSGLTWVTDEMRKSIRHRDKIVEERDIESLFLLADNADFSIALYEMLVNQCDYKPDTLNPVQRVLLICMLLENAGQADSIWGFIEEDYPEYADEAVNALNEIGATKSAEIIRQAIEISSKDGNSFFGNNQNENLRNILSKLDSEFSNYPDGSMSELYRKYADKHRSTI